MQSALRDRPDGPWKRVTPQGVAYLLRQTPHGLDRWQQDLDAVAAWCRGLESDAFNGFWRDEIFRLLLSHPDTFRGRSEREEQTFTGWTVKDGRVVETFSKLTWRARHPKLELETIEERARGWSGPREWRRAVRQMILWYGWAHRAGPPIGRRLSDLGGRVGLSARQVRRIVMRREVRDGRLDLPAADAGGVSDPVKTDRDGSGPAEEPVRRPPHLCLLHRACAKCDEIRRALGGMSSEIRDWRARRYTTLEVVTREDDTRKMVREIVTLSPARLGFRGHDARWNPRSGRRAGGPKAPTQVVRLTEWVRS
jgi:hypothetical protein